jgi:hypothetical protein
MTAIVPNAQLLLGQIQENAKKRLMALVILALPTLVGIG